MGFSCNSDRLRLARTLSLIEDQIGDWRGSIGNGLRDLNNTQTIGITGPPGAGKSTLINAMATHWADRGLLVGILAVDPSSPFSGGAVLGDRIRMTQAEGHDNIFIRSVSARGFHGGMSRAIIDLSCALAHFGCDKIIVETIGVGQNEIEVAFTCDCTLVVCVPGLGDSVQTAKAGLMEVGDIYCVNKSDLPDAGRVAEDIRNLIGDVFPGNPGTNKGDNSDQATIRINNTTCKRFGLDGEGIFWHPPVTSTSTKDAAAIKTLCRMIDEYCRWLEESNVAATRNQQRAEFHIRSILKQRLLNQALEKLTDQNASLGDWGALVNAGKTDAYLAVDTMVGMVSRGPKED